tara:strand:+ start:1919 stop:2659 length:741 start_codon:yes stop_codon:yes gene_type:complete
MLDLAGFKNFFKYYKGEEHQDKALEILFNSLPQHIKSEQSNWVSTYRTPSSRNLVKEVEEKLPWPITKTQMGRIMNRADRDISDECMDDFARCVELYNMNTLSMAYFLGQCAHESAGLKYVIEIKSGTEYEWRTDLGNNQAGDGVKFAGTGYIQTTGRYWHTKFSEYLESKDQDDPKILEEGKEYTSQKYPWSISGFWWNENGMNEYCQGWPDVDRVGARVNGRYLPNGFRDRRWYSNLAFDVLGL